jgi:hypothetical protein
MFTVELINPLFLQQPSCPLSLVIVPYILQLMHWLPEAGEPALIPLTSNLTKALYSVLGVSLRAGGNVTELLCIQATKLHFLEAVGFFACSCNSANFYELSLYREKRLLEPLCQSFCVCLSFCLSLAVMNSSAPTGKMFRKADLLGFLENLSRKFKTVTDMMTIEG